MLPKSVLLCFINQSDCKNIIKYKKDDAPAFAILILSLGILGTAPDYRNSHASKKGPYVTILPEEIAVAFGNLLEKDYKDVIEIVYTGGKTTIFYEPTRAQAEDTSQEVEHQEEDPNTDKIWATLKLNTQNLIRFTIAAVTLAWNDAGFDADPGAYF